MIKLSITGADDNVNVQELWSLVKEYPQLELGILYMKEKESLPRNPGNSWREHFLNVVPKKNTAIHLCGDIAFQNILSKDFKDTNFYLELTQYSRVQLNINARKKNFSQEQVLDVYSILLNCGFDIILQYHDDSKETILKALDMFKNYKKQIYILLDSSLGKGVVSKVFEVPSELKGLGFKLGFAGGLSSENIERVHQIVKELNVDYWLDLESSVRIDNQFLMDIARKLCRLVFNK